MRINTNLSALNTQRVLGKTSAATAKQIGRLSSGFRINSAADDAAGLGIANKFRADTRSMVQASRNAEQATSLLQIAEGSTNTLQSMLERMKELATQAASDTVSTAGRAQLQKEFDVLVDEIDRTVSTTKFQGTSLLDGSASSLKFMVSSSGDFGTNDAVEISLGDLRSTALGSTGLELNGLKTVNGAGTPASAFTDVLMDATAASRVGLVPADPAVAGSIAVTGTATAAINSLSVRASGTDTFQYSTNGTSWTDITNPSFTVSGLTFDVSGITNEVAGDQWNYAVIADTTAAASVAAPGYIAGTRDAASAAPALSGDMILNGTYSGTANATLDVQYDGTNFEYSTDGTTWTTVTGSTFTVDGVTVDMGTIANEIDGDTWSKALVAADGTTGGVLTRTEAEATLGSLDEAIAQLSNVLGDIGAAQNRVDYATQNVKTSVENFRAAESTIRDADMAAEMTELSRAQILQQVGTAMLAQANQAPQGVLQLLR